MTTFASREMPLPYGWGTGGMQQRLHIARNLVTGPRLVFMDEPTVGLDVSVQARLLDLLRTLTTTLHLSVLIVTHDIGVARRLMVMQGGAVVESGLTDQGARRPPASLYADTATAARSSRDCAPTSCA